MKTWIQILCSLLVAASFSATRAQPEAPQRATGQSEPGAQATDQDATAGAPARGADDSNPQSPIPNPQSIEPTEFDLDAFIASLNPPTVEEIIKSLEPIPTLEEVLASLDEPAPPRPELPEEVAARVAELGERIAELRKAGMAGDDEALAEAIELAEQVLAIRQEHQSGRANADGEPDAGLVVDWRDSLVFILHVAPILGLVRSGKSLDHVHGRRAMENRPHKQEASFARLGPSGE